MLLEKDPCKDCLIQPVCIKMCDKIIDFYKGRVRQRPKSEVEHATGYYWEDDYTDDNGIVHVGQPTYRRQEKDISMEPVEEPLVAFTSVQKSESWYEKIKKIFN